MNRDGRRLSTFLVAMALFAAAVTYVAKTFEWSEALPLLSRIDAATFVGGSGAALLAYWWVRAWRWRLLMRGMGVECRFLSLYLCSSVALSLAVLTPLQSGEALKVELLRKCIGGGRLPGYSALVLERMADLYAVVTLGIVSAATKALSPMSGAIVAMALICLPVVAYRLFRLKPPAGRLGELVAQMRSGVQSLPMFIVFLIATFAGWLLVAAAWQACLRSVSVHVDAIELLGLLALVTLATLASFVPAGLGVAEAGISGVLINYGIDPPLAQAGALAMRAFSVLVIGFGGLHLLWLRLHWKYARPDDPLP